jgi:hypothetical protein
MTHSTLKSDSERGTDMTTTVATCNICGAQKDAAYCQSYSGDNRGLTEAALLMAKGTPPAGINSRIREMGYSDAMAKSTVAHAFQQEEDGGGDGMSGGIGVLLGIAMIIGGIVATMVSYSGANPGDSYTIWWGISVVGVIVLIKGLMKS